MSRSIIALALAALCVTPASAQQDRPVMLVVGGTVAYDSNIFYLTNSAPDPVTPDGKTTRADVITSAYVGVRVDKSYAQQRFLLDVTKSMLRYENFTYLDFDPLNYRAAWQWQLGPRIGGTVAADRSESLVNYADFREPVQNIRTLENRLVSANAQLFGGWSVGVAATQQDMDNSVTFSQQPSSATTGGEVGVKYVTGADNTIAFNLRSLDGEYIDQPIDPATLVDNGYMRYEAELLATWKLSGKSAFTGRLGWIDYQSNNFSERDFSGLVGRLRFDWTAREKLGLSLSVSRDLSAWTADYASYRAENLVGIGATWTPTARILLRASFDLGSINYLEPVPSYTGPLRQDKLRKGQLAFEWKAARNLTATASFQGYHQTSNDPNGEFQGSLVTLGASFAF